MNKIVLITGATGSIDQDLSHELERQQFEALLARVVTHLPASET